ncbi:MAG: response regulator, partial [Planctomycetia bacterium]|nr:response regulator [Planctomycetia bacterium]
MRSCSANDALDAARPTGRVLVVDDSESARESMVLVLRHAGHEVEGVSCGAAALRAAEKTAYDVVLTDLQMPGMDGLELIRQLAKRQG